MYKLLLLVFGGLYAYSAVAQDTLYYQHPRERVNTVKDCDYFVILSKDPSAPLIREMSYTPSGAKISEQFYTIEGTDRIIEGERKNWYPSGRLKSAQHYEKGKKEGELITYWEDGKIKRRDIFKNDSLIKGQCFNNKGEEVAHFPYEVLPQFPGGEKAFQRYLKRKIYYPQSNDRIEGVVRARFVVTEKGDIENVEMLNKSNKMMQREVSRVLRKMPKWEPGKIDGEPVSMYYTLPVTFSIMPTGE